MAEIKIPAFSAYNERDEGLIEGDLVTTQKIKLNCQKKIKVNCAKNKTEL